ncbi:TPA: hypothetical protein PTV68_002028 [Clostridium botulinum]|uniref:hypothetical protein n=1 Tax=Clostridium botulinum TaxID=1491 RepID=UPI000773B595|nr:hypothetical protein [Clostridium botulinum]AUN03393.1 hypothetical protein RSJ19_10865 [Clostridium botulinum]HDK7158899.1 hypothetical protein [Clostridium botulinum]HDK7188692.1 hypothetical protein [Clostridium botulinum]HDK7215611.1 hypothetical protein [Clostridium botulinum]HDK7231365.1 hypothetical protein [Clostridium botulinum]
MKKVVIGLLTALILGVNVSSAYAAESCPRCGATVGTYENHSCCDYLGHDKEVIQNKNGNMCRVLVYCKTCGKTLQYKPCP